MLSFEGEFVVLGPPNTEKGYISAGVGSLSSEKRTHVAGVPHSEGDIAWLVLEPLSECDETSSVSAGKTANWIQGLLLE